MGRSEVIEFAQNLAEPKPYAQHLDSIVKMYDPKQGGYYLIGCLDLSRLVALRELVLSMET